MGDDIRYIPPNTKGTVKCVDDIGTMHCEFDNYRNSGPNCERKTYYKCQCIEEYYPITEKDAMEFSFKG